MILSKQYLGILQEQNSILQEFRDQDIFFENDDGLIYFEPDDSDASQYNENWYTEMDPAAQQAAAQGQMSPEELAAAQQAAAQGQMSPEELAAAQQAAAQQAEMPSEDDLIAMQISQTQTVFTKIYLVKRISKLKKYLNNLIELLELKVDIDSFEDLKRIKEYIDVLDKVALILPAETLYHIVANFEFEILDILEQLDKEFGLDSAARYQHYLSIGVPNENTSS